MKIRVLVNFLFLLKEYNFLIDYPQSIVLHSMPKSGTNYLRLLLTNYFYNLINHQHNSDNYERIEYDLMHHKIFPNVRNYIYSRQESYQKPKLPLEFTNGTRYKNFMYDHGSVLDNQSIYQYFKPKRIIHLYRNPYDNLVSKYYYNFKNRVGSQDKYKHPREIISEYITYFAEDYIKMKEYENNNKNALMVSYEELKLDTEGTLSKILKDHLDVPIHQNLMQHAIDSSSIKKVKETEKRLGKPIHSVENSLKGSFVRSGSIGQWKNYFNEEDIANINQILEEYSIDINDFIFSE